MASIMEVVEVPRGIHRSQIELGGDRGQMNSQNTGKKEAHHAVWQVLEADNIPPHFIIAALAEMWEQDEKSNDGSSPDGIAHQHKCRSRPDAVRSVTDGLGGLNPLCFCVPVDVRAHTETAQQRDKYHGYKPCNRKLSLRESGKTERIYSPALSIEMIFRNGDPIPAAINRIIDIYLFTGLFTNIVYMATKI